MFMKLCFVTGLNRSGTTLLHSLLSGHSHIFTTDFEDGMISGLARAGNEFEEALLSGRPGKLLRVLSYYTEYEVLRLSAKRGYLPTPGRWGGQERQQIPFELDFNAFEGEFFARIMKVPEYRPLSVKSMGGFLIAFYETLAIHRGCPNRPIIASKPGLGADTFLRASAHLGDLHPALLCVQRDPRAVISSTIQHLPDTAIGTLTDDWRRDQAAIDSLQRSGTYPMLVVRYEELVEEPGRIMQEVAAFLDVPFEESLLNPEIGGTAFQGNSSFGGQEAGISQGSAERWKTALAPVQIRDIERRLVGPMQRAKYALTTSPAASSVAYNLRDEWTDLKAKIGQHLPKTRTAAAGLTFAVGLVLGVALTAITMIVTR
jgi:hypothetical protein